MRIHADPDPQPWYWQMVTYKLISSVADLLIRIKSAPPFSTCVCGVTYGRIVLADGHV